MLVPEPHTAQARAELATASLDAVEEHLDDVTSEHGEVAAELVEEYKVRAELASIEGQDAETKTGQLVAQQRLRLVAIEAAREAGGPDRSDRCRRASRAWRGTRP